MKTTVIYHSADFDGVFCREIAKKFIPDADLVGWNFGDSPLKIPNGPIYILDLPVDGVFGFDYKVVGNQKGPKHPAGLVWIDHHKSSIESHPSDIVGYRIDGVAACRLAWQWFDYHSKGFDGHFNQLDPNLPRKDDYIHRRVSEPWAVRLAGEYDIWDKRDSDAELFQHGLRSEQLHSSTWDDMLSIECGSTVVRLLNQGRALEYAKAQENESIIKSNGFTVKWEGLTFLACNASRFNSHLFKAGINPEHDALLGFSLRSNGKWVVSLYGSPNRPDLDLSAIASRYGGGGHRQACGFTCDKLPFITSM